MIRQIWIVVGATGEYDSWREWTVVAVTNKKSADAIAARLNKASQALIQELDWEDYLSTWQRLAWKARMKEVGDPNAYLDYGGTRYTVKGPINLIVSVKELEL